MLVDLVTGALLSLDGAMFTELESCPWCGGELQGHDMKKKRFASVLDKGKKKDISVFVKRFYCRDCGRLCYADAPFYPDTRLGSPVVDMCVANFGRFPYHHISRLLKAMNILVDRGTVRNYARRRSGQVPAIEMYGVQLPLSLLALSDVAFRSERRTIQGTEILSAIRSPSAGRAYLFIMGSSEKRQQRYK